MENTNLFLLAFGKELILSGPSAAASRKFHLVASLYDPISSPPNITCPLFALPMQCPFP